MTIKASKIKACKECGSTALTWQTSIVNRSSVQQGRLNTHDVECVFILGCDHCSETLATVSADNVASLMSKSIIDSATEDDSKTAAVKLSSALAVLRKVEMTPLDSWYKEKLNVEVAQILRDNEPSAT